MLKSQDSMMPLARQILLNIDFIVIHDDNGLRSATHWRPQGISEVSRDCLSTFARFIIYSDRNTLIEHSNNLYLANRVQFKIIHTVLFPSDFFTEFHLSVYICVDSQFSATMNNTS